MNREFDVIVIGAGVIGCGTAWELSQKRLSIAVLEKRFDVAEGASKANSGLVHAGFDCKPGTLKAKYNVLGNEMFDQWADTLGVKLKRDGALVVAFNEEEENILNELLARGNENGVPGLRIIRGDELREMEPTLSPDITAALFAPTAGTICPYGLTCALADAAKVNGTEFFFGAGVTGISKLENGWKITTEAGEFSAKAVVNAAGAYSEEIYKMVSPDCDITITPRRGEYWMIDRTAADTLPTRTVFFTPTERGKGILISPTVDGTLLIGPTAYAVDEKDDVSTTADGLADVKAEAVRLCPNVAAAQLFTTFAGNRATGSTGDFVIGEAGDAPMFFNAIGVESPGLSSAPAISKALCEEISEKLGVKNKGWNELGNYEKPKKRFFDMTDEERAEAIAENPDYGKIVCRCELVTEAEIRAAIRRPVGARSLDGVKKRTRAGMGRCQAGFCSPRTMEILCEELDIKMTDVTKFGGKSVIGVGTLSERGGKRD